jgi:hypothetical protein
MSSDRAKVTVIGQFFSSRLNREVPIVVNNQTGRAILRAQPGRGRQRSYWLEVTWGGVMGASVPPPAETGVYIATASAASAAPAVALVAPTAPTIGSQLGTTAGNNLDW